MVWIFSGTTQCKHFPFLVLNLDTMLSDTTPERFANIWQIKWYWRRSTKFEISRNLLSRNFATMGTWNILFDLCVDHIQLFRERLSEKMCTRQARKVIWDMINALFLTLSLLNLLLLLYFKTRKHTPVASRAILSNFFEEKWTQNYPQYLSGLLCALFPTTFLEIAAFPVMSFPLGILRTHNGLLSSWLDRLKA